MSFSKTPNTDIDYLFDNTIEQSVKKVRKSSTRAIAFSDDAIFGKGFSRTNKLDDICAMNALIELGILDIDGRVRRLLNNGKNNSSGVNDASSSSFNQKKLLWQYLRYLWTNNQDSIFFSSWNKEQKQGVLLAKNVVQSIYQVSGGVGEITRDVARSWGVPILIDAINVIVEREKPNIPYISNMMNLVLKKLNQEAELFPKIEELLSKLQQEVEAYKTQKTPSVGVYEKQPDNIRVLVDGSHGSDIKVVL